MGQHGVKEPFRCNSFRFYFGEESIKKGKRAPPGILKAAVRPLGGLLSGEVAGGLRSGGGRRGVTVNGEAAGDRVYECGVM